MIAAVVWIAVMVLVALCSCTTKKTVTETVYIHDTVHVSHSDTVRLITHSTDTVHDYKFIHLHDTIFHESKQVIVLNEQGDTIRQKEWDSLFQKYSERLAALSEHSHAESDSTLRHENDSLRHALSQSHEKTTVKTKPPIDLGDYAIFLLIVSAVLVYAWKTKG